MSRAFLKMLPFFALASGMEPINDINSRPVYHGGSSRGNRPRVEGLTKKQQKARVRAKMAKKSRKINYRKAKK